jgi:hypothetical protein
MWIKTVPLFIFFVLFLENIYAQTWYCSNNTFEVACADGKCETHSDFTPINVTFNTKGSLHVCGYSGCWEGVARVYRYQNHTIYIGKNFISEQANKKEDFFISIDSDDNISLFKGLGFAMPMECERKVQ